MQLQKVVLRNLCEITSSKRIFVADYQSDGIPFYRGKEISEKYKGNLDVSTELFISESKYLEIKEKFGVPEPGDLLLTSVGTLGNPYVVKEGEVFYFKDGNLTWFRNFKDLDNNFLFYWLVSPQGKAELKKCTIGSSQSAFTIVLLKDIQIELPPLPIQRKIVDVLSAYDDLIEVNTRRIRVLEALAQSVYREWFGNVDANAKSLPRGWEMKELQDTELSIIDGDRGKNYPSKSEFTKEGYCLFLNAGNFKDDRFDYSDNDFITEEKDSLLRKGRLQPNDTILTTRGTVGKIAFFSKNAPYRNMRINSGMVIIRPKENSLYWYFLLKSPLLKEQYKSYASGSAQPQLPIKDMNKINVLVPAKNIISQFCEIVEPIAVQIEILLRKNANLRRTRDLLLPRLVSGEVAVNGL